MIVPESNYLPSLAADVRETVSRFKRSSLEAHQAYIEAGGKLVEARGECRLRGQWGAFLQVAGVDGRTARNMMTLARAGLTAGQIFRHGGVRGALEALRAAAAGAVEAAGEALDGGDVGAEKAETVSGNADSEPEPRSSESARIPDDLDERRAAVQREIEADRERENIQRIAEGVKRELAPRAHAPVEPPVGLQDGPMATQPLLSFPVEPVQASPGVLGARNEGSPLTLRQWRRAEGLCADCGEPSPSTYRCPECREARALASARAASRRRIGRELEGRIETAAARGRGVRLTAADGRSLVDADRARLVKPANRTRGA